MESNPPSGLGYLAEGPQGFQNSCDILLKLDDGKQLPAHSQILAHRIPLFAGMMDKGGPLTKATAANVVEVPFGDCSLVEATSFISALYSFEPRLHIDKADAFAIARLADKYDVKVNCAINLNEHSIHRLAPPPTRKHIIQDSLRCTLMLEV